MKTSFALVLSVSLVACGSGNRPLFIEDVPADASFADGARIPESGAIDESAVDGGGGSGDDGASVAPEDAGEASTGVADEGGIATDAERSRDRDARADVSLDGPVGAADAGPEASPGSPGGPLFDPCSTAPRPGYDPIAGGLGACCVGVGPAHCVPREQVTEALSAQLDACDEPASVCMPDEIIRGGGNYRPADCTSSLFASAGACLSRCIAFIRGRPEAAFLQQDGCGEGDLCVPCVNPLNGMPTGACQLVQLLCPADASAGGVIDAGAVDGPSDDVSLDGAVVEDAGADVTPSSGDEMTAPGEAVDAAGGIVDAHAESEAVVMCPYTGPPLLNPALFPSCSPACGGAHCVPQSLIPATGQALLASCVSLGGVPGSCAPDAFIESAGNFVPRSCTSIAGAEGRCISQCIPAVAERGDLLPSGGCAGDERCVPCFDPTAADPAVPTGVCSIASCDHPAQPPVTLTCPWTGPAVLDPHVFDECSPACAGAHCLPAELVPDSLRAQLAACSGGFCAPDSVIASAGNAVPPACVAFAGTSAAGRCLSTCLPEVQAEPALEQSTCAPDSRCVPCNDPLTGADTGACSMSCDSAPSPPYQFAGCCNIDGAPQGRCVPRGQIPDAEETSLLADVCTEAGSLCVPSELLPGGSTVSCSATIPPFLTYQGRCLSTCLNLGVGGALIPRGDCPTNHVCFPCDNAPTVPGCN